MLLRTITLSNSGNVCLDGGGYILALGYECNRGIYQLQLRPTGEWDGLTIRACWHLPDGTSTTTLAVDGCMDVPAAVTALPGTGCITFEGAAEGKTITSSDLRYLVGDNSGVEDRTMPEPDTPAWEQLVGTVAESTAQAEAAADRADKAAAAAEGALIAVEGAASKALTDITHTGAAQTQAVTRAGEQAVKEVDAAARAGVGSVEQAQKTATQAVQTAATAAIQQVEQTGGTQVQAIAAAGAAQVQAVEAAAAQKLESITQLAGQAEDSATKAEQAAQRAEDAAAATSAIIDDTAITPAKTWSSLHILDALCPPIQATGNPVVCHPVEGYPLGVTVDFAPIQEGAGDPSPENVRPIKAREGVTVERCGENLLDESRFPIIKTQNYIRTTSEMTLPAGTYTVCVLSVANGVYARGADVEYTYNSNKHTFTLARQTAIRLDAYWSKGRPEKDENIWLIEGNEWRPYTPYTGQTATLTLPAPCYGGELDAVTGKGQETWKLLTLDGNDLKFSPSENNKFWNMRFYTAPGIAFPAQIKCTHINGSLFWLNTNYDFIFTTKKQMVGLFETVDELNAYCAAQYAAGTPIQIAYKVATPTPITATGDKPIPALAGTNTVLTDGDSLTVTGREDPTHEIQQLRAAVVALGGHEPEDMAKLDKAI